jgi:hypothetical protein
VGKKGTRPNRIWRFLFILSSIEKLRPLPSVKNKIIEILRKDNPKFNSNSFYELKHGAAQALKELFSEIQDDPFETNENYKPKFRLRPSIEIEEGIVRRSKNTSVTTKPSATARSSKKSQTYSI